MTTLDVEPRLDQPDTGSPDDRSHLCRKEDITRAVVEGGKVTALCGVEFEPVRDPEQFPPCDDCLRLLSQLDQRGSS